MNPLESNSEIQFVSSQFPTEPWLNDERIDANTQIRNLPSSSVTTFSWYFYYTAGTGTTTINTVPFTPKHIEFHALNWFQSLQRWYCVWYRDSLWNQSWLTSLAIPWVHGQIAWGSCIDMQDSATYRVTANVSSITSTWFVLTWTTTTGDAHVKYTCFK